MKPKYDRLFIAFIYYFNVKRDYFECHEVLEELWLEEGRDPLLQGLLQVAVGLYHHGNGNVSGAIKLLSQAVDKLKRYPADSLGIHLGRVLADSEVYLEKLRRIDAAPFAPYDLDIEVRDPELADAVAAFADKPFIHDDED